MRAAVALAEGISAITPDRLENLARAAMLTNGLPCAMAEVGVWRGGSALVLASLFPERDLHLFDTFNGLPFDEDADMDPDGQVKAGMFAAGIAQVRRRMAGTRVVFHPGIFPATTRTVRNTRFAFVHIDCDLYRTAYEASCFFWPRMELGGILYFDDYGCRFTGVTRAVDELFHPQRHGIHLQRDQYGNQIGAYIQR